MSGGQNQEGYRCSGESTLENAVDETALDGVMQCFISDTDTELTLPVKFSYRRPYRSFPLVSEQYLMRRVA